MANANNLDQKYQYRYIVAGNDAAIAASLTGDGPLWVAPAHFLNVKCPSRCTVMGADVRVYLLDAEFISLGALEPTAGLLEDKVAGWITRIRRLGQLLDVLDTNDLLDWTPVGSIEEVAMHITEAAKGLSKAQRALGRDDTLPMPLPAPPAGRRSGDGGALAAGHAMYREVTGNMVVDGGVSAFRIAEVRALFPERYNDAGRKSKEFANVADTLLGVTSAGAKIDTLTVASQANLVCTALFKNSLGAAWVSMPRENEHVGEIFRRVGPRDELFSHVFCVSWRRVLPSVSAALPKTIEGAAAMAMVARFATARLRSSGVTVVTESLASTVESSVGLLLNRLDTATLRDADNETRAKEVERVLASGEYTPGTGASRGAKGQRDDDFNQLYAQKDFKKLLQKLEAAVTVPIDEKKGCKIMLKHECIAGLVYLTQLDFKCTHETIRVWCAAAARALHTDPVPTRHVRGSSWPERRARVRACVPHCEPVRHT